MRRRQRTKINERLIPVRADGVHTVGVDGEAVLLDENTGQLHLLNPTSTLLWTCFDGESSIAEIVTDISEELHLARDMVLADTLALTRQLASEGLLANVAPRRQRVPPVGAEAPPDPRFLSEPPSP